MYEQIAGNKRKSFFLVLFFLLLIFALAWVFSQLTELGPAGVVLAVVIAVFMTFGSYYSSDKIVLAVSKARPVTKEEYPYLYNVVEGVARLRRFDDDARFTGKPNITLGQVLMDADNLSNSDMDGPHNSGDGLRAPRLVPPLRASVPTPTGIAAMRIPYLRRTGEHGFAIPDPNLKFDIHTFMINMVANYFASGGTVLKDDHCMHDWSCDWIPPPAAP